MNTFVFSGVDFSKLHIYTSCYHALSWVTGSTQIGNKSSIQLLQGDQQISVAHIILAFSCWILMMYCVVLPECASLFLPISASVAWHCHVVYFDETLSCPCFPNVASHWFCAMDCHVCYCASNIHMDVLLWICAFLMDFGLVFFICCWVKGCLAHFLVRFAISLRIGRWPASCRETCTNSYIQLWTLSDIYCPVQRGVYRWRILVILLHTCHLLWQTSMVVSFCCLFHLGFGTCKFHIWLAKEWLYKRPYDVHQIWHCSTWLHLLLCNLYQLFWICLLLSVPPRLQGIYMLVVVTWGW